MNIKRFQTAQTSLCMMPSSPKRSTRQPDNGGHSIYTTALELAISAKVKQFGLFHLNQERTDEGVDQMVDKCREIIIEQDADLKCFAVGAEMTFEL